MNYIISGIAIVFIVIIVVAILVTKALKSGLKDYEIHEKDSCF